MICKNLATAAIEVISPTFSAESTRLVPSHGQGDFPYKASVVYKHKAFLSCARILPMPCLEVSL